MSTEAQKRASRKYRVENTVSISLILNRKTDADVIEWIGRQDNRRQYLLCLIRADMAEGGK